MTASDLASTKEKKPQDQSVTKSKPKKEKSSKKRKSATLSDSSKTPALLDHGSSEINGISRPVELSNTKKILDSSEALSESRPTKKLKVDVDEIEVDITAPQPPSKKELRRLKKGKPLPRSKTTSASEPKTVQNSHQEKRSEHGIWIGNLPFHATKDDLRKFLVDNSEIKEDMITRIHMPGPNSTTSANKVEEKKFAKAVHNKGFAYVDFSNSKAVSEALELSEQLLTGRRVLIKDNKSFEGRPDKTKEESRNAGKPPSKRVFLGNLSFDTTEETLKEHFQKCGPINNIKVATFEDTGKCKGYAWVVFEDLEGAESAVRGFVRVEEPGSEPESEEGSDEAVPSGSAPKMKVRKWWVNKIKGRSLRVEFAEDAQVRYKKRYGKDGSKNAVEVSKMARDDTVEDSASVPVVPTKKVDYRQPYAPRLTGGIVESKGKKVTF
ncbi:hypothetical protein K3495_g6697 [Podosphaera aphanis]|nr:hypothetical protein K3495_g6697 [Podosphaera aphanis]